MEIKERVLKVFASVFDINKTSLKITDTKDDIETWDSIGHLQLIMTIEENFGIKLKTEEVVGMDSIEKCINIVEQRLNQK